jgi:hypothetical protein
MKHGHAIICCLLLFGCAKKEPPKVEPTSEESATFHEASTRLLAMTSPAGWVVSRWDDGSIEHTGDSLLWTGMAMGALSCDDGVEPERALLDMLSSGEVYRHPSKPKPVSMDGQLGMFWGIAQRVRRCPETAARWADALSRYVPENVPQPFLKLLSAVSAEVGLGSPPRELASLADAVNGWALAVVTSKAAAYRIHLGLLSYETLEAAGVSLPFGAREKFCLVTKGVDMPTVDHFCGRGALKAWADNFTYDSYEYRHQRAKWEDADGKLGLHTPALDLIVAMRELYDPL